jgi:hypothetical protein
MPSPRIPSVRARSKQHEAIKRKPPATSFNNPSLAVGAVGVYGPLLRGRYAQNLQASIHWTPRDQQPPSPETTLSTGGCGGTNDHDQNHDTDEDTDSKQVSVCCLWYEMSYIVIIFWLCTYSFYLSLNKS